MTIAVIRPDVNLDRKKGLKILKDLKKGNAPNLTTLDHDTDRFERESGEKEDMPFKKKDYSHKN